MNRSDSRSVMRNVLSAPQHAQAEPIQEDYGATTIGSQADAGVMGTQSWPGSQQFDSVSDGADPFESTAHALHEYQAGTLKDDQVIAMFRRLVETGLIEYMNDSVRGTAAALTRAGYIQVMSEAEGQATPFTRNVGDQPSQQGYPNFNVKQGTQYKTNSTAPVSTIGSTGSQKAQMSPAKVPPPPSGSATSQGYDKFPDSEGKKENPPKVPNPVGKQKAGPNHGDEMSGGGKGMAVGQSLQQGSQAEDGEYTGSQVGRIKEQMACPLPKKKSDDKKLRRVKRRQPE